MGRETSDAVALAREKVAGKETEYAMGAGEDRDMAYLIENTCIHCNRLMSKTEVKILPPSYIQERDQYVSGGVVKRRLMCLSCYNMLRSTAREKVRFDRFRNRGRLQTVRTTLVKMLGSN